MYNIPTYGSEVSLVSATAAQQLQQQQCCLQRHKKAAAAAVIEVEHDVGNKLGECTAYPDMALKWAMRQQQQQGSGP